MSVEMTIEEIIAHCDRQLSREPKGSIFYREHEAVKAFLMELQEFRNIGMKPEEIKKHEAAYNECLTRTYGPFKQKISQWLQAEQDGRLVMLPCKVGDTIWRIKCFADWPDIGKPYVEADAFLYRDIHYFGKTVFLTREEAEAALKGGGC